MFDSPSTEREGEAPTEPRTLLLIPIRRNGVAVPASCGGPRLGHRANRSRCFLGLNRDRTRVRRPHDGGASLCNMARTMGTFLIPTSGVPKRTGLGRGAPGGEPRLPFEASHFRDGTCRVALLLATTTLPTGRRAEIRCAATADGGSARCWWVALSGRGSSRNRVLPNSPQAGGS